MQLIIFLTSLAWFSLHVTSNSGSSLHRPSERSGEDVDIILTRLREVKAFQKFPSPLLLQICACAFYECLEKGITCTYACTYDAQIYGVGYTQHYLNDVWDANYRVYIFNLILLKFQYYGSSYFFNDNSEKPNNFRRC